ncbi:MAG: hypothetical protein ACR2NM_10945 [Bythopirellula sp.]
MRVIAPRALFVGATIVSLSLSSLLARATEPNETFAQRTFLDPGTLTVTDDLSPGTGTAPDTLLGIFDEGGFDPFDNFITDDDDSSTLGDGSASGVTGIGVNVDGSINFIVTGSDDVFYDGEHEETGGYKAFVEVFDNLGGSLDEFSVNDALQSGVMDQHTFTDAAWVGGSFSINLDNTVDGFTGGDVDFFTFNGLSAGAIFSAETSSLGTIDTILGWYSDTGAVLAQDDDGGQGVLSKLQGMIPLSGQLTFAVTGSGDDLFLGEHAQQEVYDLVLTIDGVMVPGDFDGSGVVDNTDLTHPSLGWEVRYSNDLHGDDYLTWQQEFVSSLAAIAVVPEPGSLALVVSSLLAASWWKNGRALR